MKNFLICLALLFSSIIYAQNDTTQNDIKYQGLLWEITGNGLEKPSYLYGTMHVSRKIAFNLDDIFFDALNKADMVAVESMPDNWLDDLFKRGEIGYGGSVGRSNYYGGNSGGFYSNAFQMNFPNKNDIISGMFGQYNLINGLLYRSEGMADFEEDTYLDMFIYQTGKRFSKGTYSLESSEESRDLVEKAMADSRKKEIDEWLKDMIEEKKTRTFDILQDAYRDRNIGLIDSLNRAMYTDHYMEYMLFKRNENMVDSMETLMQKGTLFAGVGAAHLPGDDGMIDMLLKRGYTLKPVFSEQTAKGKKLKKKFEDNFIQKTYSPQTSADGFLTLNAPNKLYELYADGGSFSIAPDFDNGSYITIARLYSYNALRKSGEEKLTEKDLEKLLFEFIPGDIITKKILSSPYPGFDIENKTKTGNHQRYLFYVTPIEIIIIKMDGKNEFVKRESSKVFSSLKFNIKDKMEVASDFGGFSVEMPGYTIVNNTKYRGQRFVQAHHEADKSYAFLMENDLNDVEYIEEDSFELAYLMEQFCKTLDTEFDENGRYVDGDVPAFYSFTVLDSVEDKRLYLNTRLLGSRYYLIGYSGEAEAAKAFFKTVNIVQFNNYSNDFEEQVDTNLFFTVKAPDKSGYSSYYSPYGRNNNDDEKSYEGYNKNQTYSVKSNEQIYIRMKKYHDWFTEEHIDSLWIDIERDYKKGKLNLTEKNTYETDSTYYFEGLLTRENSHRAIKFKYIQRRGTLYSLYTLVHKDMPLSPFVDTFYQTFTPKDTIIGISPFVDKSEMYFNAIENQDSIVITSRNYIGFEDEDFEKVKKLFLEKEFDEDWQFLKDILLNEITSMELDKTMPFLTKLYIDSYKNSDYQVQVLRRLIREHSKPTTAKVMSLMEQDLPITDEGGRFLWSLTDSSKIANPLVPQLLEYASIPDYKYDIQDIIAQLVTYKDLNPKRYKKYKKQFLNEARIELKRAIGKQSQTKSENNYYYRSYNTTRALNRYVELLYPFKKETKVKEFLAEVGKLDDTEVKSNLMRLQLIYGEPLNKETIIKLAKDDKERFSIYSLLRKYDALDLIPDSLKSPVILAKGFLSNDSYYGDEIDTIYYIKTETVKISSVAHEVHYFYKRTTREKSYYNEDKEKETILALAWKPNEKIHSYNYYDILKIKDKDETIDDIIKELRKEIQLRDRQRISNYNNYSGYGAVEEAVEY